jgi:predicted ester cyclase
MSAKQEPNRAGDEIVVVNGQNPELKADRTEKPATPQTAQRELAASEDTGQLPVMEVPGTDISKFMALQGTPRRQSMRGFDTDYVDIVDYIIRVTHRIWEEKAVGLIYDTYSQDCIIHTSDGTTYGRDKVVADTIIKMAAFPDLRVIASDVIWGGNDVDGFHSSHRLAWIGTNTGWSSYGAPTNRRSTRLSLAHCVIKENRIVEEWMAGEYLNVIWGQGLDGHKLAREAAYAEAAAGLKPPVPQNFGEIERVFGQTTPEPLPPKPTEFELENFIKRFYQEVWNWRMFNKVNEYCIPNYQSHVATNRDLYGLGDYKAYILGLMAAFPDLKMSVDHIMYLGNEKDGYRVAVRWWLQGNHTGPGHYGAPSGKRIQLLGFTHFLIKDGKFVKEWTLFDEFALLKQIYWPS